MCSILFLCSLVLFDVEFIKTIFDEDESAWQSLTDDSVPPEQDLAILSDLADKLARWVPRSVLKEHANTFSSPRIGEAVQLEGNAILVTKYDSVYRCRIELNTNVIADVFVPSIPQAWKPGTPMQERVAAFGIYIKSYENIPIFAAPAIQWYPNSWLGNLGFDVGSFDQVPVRRVTEAQHQNEETNRQTFKFTESDREPFYGLLQAVSATSEGWLEKEAKKQSVNVPDLFNRPHETRGKPVLLHGTAKRIVSTPVTDSEVHALFGIDHYYQIYLFTEQSQGNSIVVCVPSLPEGMPIGDGNNFSEQITVAAVHYKLWIYDAPSGQHYAPVLVGRSLVWHPKLPEKRTLPESFTTFSFALFFTLVLLWFACRFWGRRNRIHRTTP